MSQRHDCFLLVGLVGVFSTSLLGCPLNDAAFEPLTAPPQVCSSDADCEDGNVCTKNSCNGMTFLCAIEVLDGVPTPMAPQSACLEHICTMGVDTPVLVANGVVIANQVPGDCKKVVCDGKGAQTKINDDADVKVDGFECTEDICTNGVPTNPNLPLNTPCGNNLGLTCDGNGQCRGCKADSDCFVGVMPCASAICNADGVCDMIFEPNGTFLPAADQTAANCKVRVCDGAGNVIDIPDPNDAQDDGNECTADTCNGASTVHLPKQVGAACNGNSQCDGAGHCLGRIADPCSADGECASGHCSDGVCCESTCSGLCMSCNVMGSVGICVDIPFPGTEPACSGMRVCDGQGGCALANGQSCNAGAKKCASGTCDQGKCKSKAGQPCGSNGECVSASCVNGVCM